MDSDERNEWNPTYGTFTEEEEKIEESSCYYVVDPAGWYHFSNGCYMEPTRFYH
jgi:hypothetical protein